jgi:hypothetical protein
MGRSGRCSVYHSVEPSESRAASASHLDGHRRVSRAGLSSSSSSSGSSGSRRNSRESSGSQHRGKDSFDRLGEGRRPDTPRSNRSESEYDTPPSTSRGTLCCCCHRASKLSSYPMVLKQTILGTLEAQLGIPTIRKTQLFRPDFKA